MQEQHFLNKLVVLLAMIISGYADATTIDFNFLTQNRTAYTDYPGGITNQGFRITNSADSLFSFGATSIYNLDPGGATLSASKGFSSTTLTRADGGSFDFVSIDFGDPYGTAQLWENSGVYTYMFEFTHTNGLTDLSSISVPFSTRDANGMVTYSPLKTFSFDEQNLRAVSWNATNMYGYWQADNVVLSTVPEPNSLALMLCGIALILGIGSWAHAH